MDLAETNISFLPNHLNTAILFAGEIYNEILIKTSYETFVNQLQINLTANFKLCQLLYPLFLKSTNPHLIFIGSRSALYGNSGQSAYSASKSGLMGLSTGLAEEWAKDNIKVNTVLPGFMRSKQTLTFGKKIEDKYKESTLLKHLPTLKEISDMIDFIGSSSSISGQVFACDSRINRIF